MSQQHVASVSGSSSTSSSHDTTTRWYGHEAVSSTAARYITHLFSCPSIPTPSVPSAPRPPLANFVAYALYRTQLPAPVTTAALCLLGRLKERYPAARGSSGHRLFIAAFMMASKMICDDTYSNKSWSVVAQSMFPLKEINQMEREMLGYLEWKVDVGPEELASLEELLDARFSFAVPPSQPPPAPAPPTPAPVPAVTAAPPTVSSLTTAASAYPSPPTSPYLSPSRSIASSSASSFASSPEHALAASGGGASSTISTPATMMSGASSSIAIATPATMMSGASSSIAIATTGSGSSSMPETSPETPPPPPHGVGPGSMSAGGRKWPTGDSGPGGAGGPGGGGRNGDGEVRVLGEGGEMDEDEE